MKAPDTGHWEEGDGQYVAPELLHDSKPTAAADIYSLGVSMYECATGEPFIPRISVLSYPRDAHGSIVSIHSVRRQDRIISTFEFKQNVF